jgi:hypothetical protein
LTISHFAFGQTFISQRGLFTGSVSLRPRVRLAVRKAVKGKPSARATTGSAITSSRAKGESAARLMISFSTRSPSFDLTENLSPLFNCSDKTQGRSAVCLACLPPIIREISVCVSFNCARNFVGGPPMDCYKTSSPNLVSPLGLPTYEAS